MENEDYYNQRLEEIGRMLFAEGAFFHSMKEEERDLFGEAIYLLATKAMKENSGDSDNTCDQPEQNGDLAGAIRQAIDFAKGGFNINVNVTPNNMGGGCQCPSGCQCGNCDKCMPDMYEDNYNSGDYDYKGDSTDEYYNSGSGDGGYYGGSGSGYAHDKYTEDEDMMKSNVNTTKSNLDEYYSEGDEMMESGINTSRSDLDEFQSDDVEMINDGTYDPIEKTDEELMYGEDMPIKPEDGTDKV